MNIIEKKMVDGLLEVALNTVESLQDTIETMEAGGWKSLENNMPSNEGQVLIWTEYGAIEFGHAHKGLIFDKAIKGSAHEEFTHWMEIPRPPE